MARENCDVAELSLVDSGKNEDYKVADINLAEWGRKEISFRHRTMLLRLWRLPEFLFMPGRGKPTKRENGALSRPS